MNVEWGKYKSQIVWRIPWGWAMNIWAHRDWKQKSQVQYGYTLDPLNIYYSYYLSTFMRLLIVRMGESLTLLPALRTHFLLLDCSPNICMIEFISSYYIVFCHVWWLSLKILFFLMWDKKGEKGSRSIGYVERNWRSRGRESYNQNILHKKRI